MKKFGPVSGAGTDIQYIAVIRDLAEFVSVSKSPKIGIGVLVDIIIMSDTIPKAAHFFRAPVAIGNVTANKEFIFL